MSYGYPRANSSSGVRLSLLHGTLCPQCKAEPKKVFQRVGENCFRLNRRNESRKHLSRTDIIHQLGAYRSYGG